MASNLIAMASNLVASDAEGSFKEKIRRVWRKGLHLKPPPSAETEEMVKDGRVGPWISTSLACFRDEWIGGSSVIAGVGISFLHAEAGHTPEISPDLSNC